MSDKPIEQANKIAARLIPLIASMMLIGGMVGANGPRPALVWLGYGLLMLSVYIGTGDITIGKDWE